MPYLMRKHALGLPERLFNAIANNSFFIYICISNTRDVDTNRINSLTDDIKKGNREAFNEFFCLYYPRLLAYASAIVEDEIAEDITQDVFLYVWENRKRLNWDGGFHSYLFQAAYTRCLDYFKKNCSAEKYTTHVMFEHARLYSEFVNDNNTILEELYSKDFYKQLYTLLDQIPFQRREVFILAYIQGLKTKEIAELLKLPQRTVESHIYLTLKYLKGKMAAKDFLMLCQLLSIPPVFMQ